VDRWSDEAMEEERALKPEGRFGRLISWVNSVNSSKVNESSSFR
jgi:hypothetical protein